MAALIIILITVGVIASVVALMRASTRSETQGDRAAEVAPPGNRLESVIRFLTSQATIDSFQPTKIAVSQPIPADDRQLRWFGKGEVLQVHGFEIHDPLTYVGSTGRRSRPVDPSQIDPTLDVEARADALPLPYWPWYGEMTPEQRYLYLRWLASDRTFLPPADGYLFIYYYGLERRALVDKTDHVLVFDEVNRLRTMHAAQSQTRSRSFQSYSSEFLWYLSAAHSRHYQPRHVKALAESTRSWSEDSLAAALAWFAERQYPLESWMAFAIAAESPLSQRSVVVQRVAEEFSTLFARRYESEFGQGMILRTAKRDRRLTYRPASAALQPVTADVANPLGIPSQFRRLPEIWNDCIAELRKLSSVARGGLSESPTVEAWEAMPAELRAGIDHPSATHIYALVSNHTDEDGHTFLRVGDVATALGVENRSKLTGKQSRSLVTTAEYAGYAIEPDVRLTGRSYAWDDLVAAFPHAYEGEPDYKRFGGAACVLRLGMEIAEADGRVDEEELRRVMGQIETGFQLNEHERRRLEALRSLLVRTGSDIAGLGKRLQSIIDLEGRRAIGRLLVAVAGLDGVITKSELTALRRCFRALDLPPEWLETTIAELAPSADEAPVRMAPGKPAPAGERIPPEPPTQGRLTLDRARIMRIMEETREVSMLLAEAMRVEAERAGTESAVESFMEGSVSSTSTFSVSLPSAAVGAAVIDNSTAALNTQLPDRYVAFYAELSTKDRWPRVDADDLARRHGHMLSGALEALNDWAFERVGSQVIYEDGDCIVVEKHVLEKVEP